MRSASGALGEYLAQNDNVVIADLYTFSLPSGRVLRYSGWTTALTIPGTAFPSGSLNYDAMGYTDFALGPRFGRSMVTIKIGVEPAELDITVMAGADDMIGTFAFAEAVRVGELDGATVELDRFFAPPQRDGGALSSTLGAIVWFCGQVAETDAGRTSIAIKVKSLMNLLAAQQMPRRLYQAACTHVFGDAMCRFDRASLSSTQAALAGSTQAQVVTALTPSPATLYDQGTIVGVTGLNAGQKRTIVQLSGGIVSVLKAWLYPVAVGDTFELLPGCDHTTATCLHAFNNLIHYGGFPYIPPPELAV
ncbi:MAG TPA: DUF2163 domain-containing protein [Stellaceae bacterium]